MGRDQLHGNQSRVRSWKVLTWAPPGAELPAKPPAGTFARSRPCPAPLTSHTGRRWRLVPRSQQVTPGRPGLLGASSGSTRPHTAHFLEGKRSLSRRLAAPGPVVSSQARPHSATEPAAALAQENLQVRLTRWEAGSCAPARSPVGGQPPGRVRLPRVQPSTPGGHRRCL